MEILERVGYCTCCNIYSQQLFGEDNFDPNTFDLENYKRFKDFYVTKCPNCGFVSFDLTRKEDSEKYLKIKGSEELEDLLDYDYLEGFDLEIYECHTKSVPANLYDQYCFMLSGSENEYYFRALNKAVELKEIILEKYRESVEDDGDDDDREIFEKLKILLTKNIEQERKIFVTKFWDFNDKNVFSILLLIENLVKLGEYEKAKKNFDWLCLEAKLDENLMSYFKRLTERG